MIDFGFFRIKRRLAGVGGIGISKSHGTIRRFDIGANDRKSPRGLAAGFVAKTWNRVAYRAIKQLHTRGSVALAIAGTCVASAGKNDTSRGSDFDVDQRHVASGSRGLVVWRRRDATTAHAGTFSRALPAPVDEPGEREERAGPRMAAERNSKHDEQPNHAVVHPRRRSVHPRLASLNRPR